MEQIKQWWERFSTWVKYEPVKASEQVRMLLLSITAIAGVSAGDPVVTGIMGVVTAVFSIWASKRTRDSVMPMERVESEYETRKIETLDTANPEDYKV